MMRMRRRTASVDSLAGSVIAARQPEKLDEAGDHAERAEDDHHPRRGVKVLVQPPSQTKAEDDGRGEPPCERVGAGLPPRAAALLLIIVPRGFGGRRHGRSPRARPLPATPRPPAG